MVGSKYWRYYMKKQIYYKRVLFTSWKNLEDKTEGVERNEHLFVSIDGKIWEEINNKVILSDISMKDYDEIKKFFDKLNIRPHQKFFDYYQNIYLHLDYWNKVPRIKILEETIIN